MDNLELKIFALGELYTNCYLVYDKETRKAFIIDAPSPFKVVTDFIKREKLEVEFIALTHGHFDHIGGLADVSFPFGIHKDDESFFKDSLLNGSNFFSAPVNIERLPAFFLKEGTPLKFGKLSLDILHTPGHTPGSVCIKLGKWLFSGDTIFFGAVGRTDIALASHETLMRSIKNKIITLSHETIIYPGHGGSSTVAREIKENPFLNN